MSEITKGEWDRQKAKSLRDLTDWLMRCDDELAICTMRRNNGEPIALNSLRAATEYARRAVDYCSRDEFAAAQANVDASTQYYGRFASEFESTRQAMAESQRAGANASAMTEERQPINVNIDIPLTVNPVIEKRGGVKPVYDRDNQIVAIVPMSDEEQKTFVS